MTTLFKLAYSLAIGILLVLALILGIRTFYDEPEAPDVRLSLRPVGGVPLYCDFDGRCFKGDREITAEDEEQLSEDEREYIQEQRQFSERQRAYEDDRVDYRRNVFIVASALGVAAVAVGLYLFRRVEALPLGLVLGGIGIVIFGWAQAAEDFGEIGEAPLFAVVTVGLAVLLAAGYRFLGLARRP